MLQLKPLLRPTLLAVLIGVSAPSMAAQDSSSSAPRAERDEGAISMALALNRRLSPFELQVVVKGDTAVLQGKVEDDIDRQLAEQVAREVSSVKRVDNQLVLDPAVADLAPGRQPLAVRLDDLTLIAAIEAKLSWNSSTAGSDTQVAVQDGVVTLKGHAKTADAKLWAGTLAENTDGVAHVNNLISLGAADTSTAKAEVDAKTTDTSLSDEWITSKVKASFLYDRNLDALSIDVMTREGVVRLSGEVASSELRTMAVSVARNIRGVRGVDADLLRVAIKSPAS